MNRKLNSETSLGSSVSTTLYTVLAWALGLSALASPDTPIPLDQLGAAAGQQYQGNGLAVSATTEGAQLRCVFQRLTGRVTPEGLWLESTDTGGGQLHLRATAIGREAGEWSADIPVGFDVWTDGAGLAVTDVWPFQAGWKPALPPTGTVTVQDGRVQFIRPGLVEEYSVSMDGLRQDFVVLERPPLNPQPSTLNPAAEPLRVELELTGARAEALADGVRLTLDESGRELAYSRLRVTDATGRELPARMDVTTKPEISLAVLVDDSEAVYPVRIDPTFSDADWVSLSHGYPGADGEIRAIVADGNGNVYFAGEFSIIGTCAANGIAKWDGSTWSALGAGVQDYQYGQGVKALAVSGTNVYAAVSRTVQGWNGIAWSALGSGMDSNVLALAVIGNTLYAGGEFNTAGGIAGTKGLAKWNGSSWSAVGSGISGSAYALAVSGTDLYVGGDFGTAMNSDGGTVTVNRIAKWDGSAWSAVGSGISGSAYALAVSGTDVYVAVYGNVQRWNGIAWSALGSGLIGDTFDVYSGRYYSVLALAVSGTNLYAGGAFTNAGGMAVNRVARWNGSTWSALGSGVSNGYRAPDGLIRALAVSGDTLYAGGDFRAAGGLPAINGAKWDGSAWSTFGSGLLCGYDGVTALAVSGTNLYVGGNPIISAGGVWINGIAKWNGTAWSGLGAGVGGSVYDLAVSGNTLYAGGDFMRVTNSGGGTVTVNYIARWNGSSWSALGSGMNASVKSLAVSGNTLYAGGNFTRAGGVAANGIARWNGASWSALGAGITNGAALALAVSGSDLYVGGAFDLAGGLPAKNIARWNGSSWSALGSGLNGYVFALAVSGTDLYAGGSFDLAGGLPASKIAKWNGTSWSSLGAGMGLDLYGAKASVDALAVSGTNLYAGGEFTAAGTVFANCIAKWDGTAWSALGSGVSSQNPYETGVYALALDEAGHLFVGGAFMLAGDKVSPYLAQANLTPQPMVIKGIRAEAGVVTLDCWGAAGGVCAVQRATDVQFTQNLTTLHTTNAPPDGRFTCTDATPPATTAFYRLMQP